MTAFLFDEGMMRAKKSWVSLEIPETGLRSVSPRARTPMTERKRARRMAMRVAYIGTREPKTIRTEMIQRTMDVRKPIVTTRLDIRWEAGASGSEKDVVEEWDEA